MRLARVFAAALGLSLLVCLPVASHAERGPSRIKTERVPSRAKIVEVRDKLRKQAGSYRSQRGIMVEKINLRAQLFGGLNLAGGKARVRQGGKEWTQPVASLGLQLGPNLWGSVGAEVVTYRRLKKRPTLNSSEPMEIPRIEGRISLGFGLLAALYGAKGRGFGTRSSTAHRGIGFGNDFGGLEMRFNFRGKRGSTRTITGLRLAERSLELVEKALAAYDQGDVYKADFLRRRVERAARRIERDQTAFDHPHFASMNGYRLLP